MKLFIALWFVWMIMIILLNVTRRPRRAGTRTRRGSSHGSSHGSSWDGVASTGGDHSDGDSWGSSDCGSSWSSDGGSSWGGSSGSDSGSSCS